MTTSYDIERPEFMWLVDGQPATGNMDQYLADFAGPEAVRGLWRIDVHTADGDDIQPVLVFVAPGESPTNQVVPHSCTSCGVSMGDCDRMLARSARPCCPTCHWNDTHGDTDWEASCARMDKVRAEVAREADGG